MPLPLVPLPLVPLPLVPLVPLVPLQTYPIPSLCKRPRNSHYMPCHPQGRNEVEQAACRLDWHDRLERGRLPGARSERERKRCASSAMLAEDRRSLSCHAAASVRPGKRNGAAVCDDYGDVGGEAHCKYSFPIVVLAYKKPTASAVGVSSNRYLLLFFGARSETVRFPCHDGSCPVQSVVPCSCQCSAWRRNGATGCDDCYRWSGRA